MPHNDTFSDPICGDPNRPLETTAISPNTVEQTSLSIPVLATPQNSQAPSSQIEQSQALSTPELDKVLPFPSRGVTLSSFLLAAVLGTGALALTMLPYTTTVKAEAVVEPVGAVQPVKAGVEGTVETLVVQNYETLSEGQVLTSLESLPLRAEMANIEARITQLQTQMTEVDSQITDLEQRQFADPTGTRSLDYPKKVLLDHQGELKTKLEQRRQQLAQVQQKIEKLVVYAPAAGTLYDLKLNTLGQDVGADETIAKVIPTGVALQIKAVVPNAEIKTVEVGHPTYMTLSNCAPVSFGPMRGNVSSIEPAQSETGSGTNFVSRQDSRVVTVAPQTQTLQVGQRTCNLLPGMKGKLTIITRQERLLNLFLRKLRLQAGV
ncbi:MAG: hypothetical protein AAGI45_08175 [Cyanobacteria bacterium P01_H01_bin.26]